MPTDPARVCVLGSLCMDLVMRAPRLPGRGETLLGGRASVHPGGKGANQAVAAARLGGRVTLVGAVGDDAHGRSLRDAVASAGVDVSRVAVRDGVPTGVAHVTVAEGDGENAIVVAPGANSTLTPPDVDAARDAIAAADVLVVQLETPLDAVLRAAEVAREVGTPVLLNAAPAVSLPADLIRGSEILIANEHEAAALSGAAAADPDRALDALADAGAACAVVTLGEAGSIYRRGESRGRIAAFRVQAVDTVGAGDAFVGALAVRWGELTAAGALDDLGVRDALCWASAAGALAAAAHGAIPSLPTRDRVRALLRDSERLV